MSDLISRQVALDTFHAFVPGIPWDMLDKIFAEIPTAQPMRKKGKWIYGEDEYGVDGYHCDKCGFFVPWDYAHKFINYIEDYNFCPTCGCQMMRGDAE